MFSEIQTYYYFHLSLEEKEDKAEKIDNTPASDEKKG